MPNGPNYGCDCTHRIDRHDQRWLLSRAGERPASVHRRCGDQWEAVEELPQVHHLTREELRDREACDGCHLIDVGDDAPYLRAREAVRLGTDSVSVVPGSGQRSDRT
jgi:hypothetical protein